MATAAPRLSGVGDGPQPFVVVLTGGPSSGKSSALALLRDRLSARGFQVLTVPENATHFLTNSDGFQPEWAGQAAQAAMQRIFLNFQISQEEAFKSFAALHPSKPAVLLLDCCTLNSKVYVSDEQWVQVLRPPGQVTITEDELLARYDLVIHMVTSAFSGHYEWGPGSNNPGRYHTPEQAKEQDGRCLRVFQAHPQLRVVPHFPHFDEKIGKVVEFVNDALHVEGLAGKRSRRPCRVTSLESLELVVSRASTSASQVMTSFLDSALQHSVRRDAKLPSQTWLAQFRQHHLGNGLPGTSAKADSESLAAESARGSFTGEMSSSTINYERRSEVRPAGGMADSYLTRKVISQEEYYAALGRGCSQVVGSTAKWVLRFVEGASYYELVFFSRQRELLLDFPSDVSKHADWIVFTEECLAAVSSTASAARTMDSGTPAKKRRVLRPHSTQEAAVMDC